MAEVFFDIGGETIAKTTHKEFAQQRDDFADSLKRFEKEAKANRWSRHEQEHTREYALLIEKFSDKALDDLMLAAKASEDMKAFRALDAILEARAGKFNKVIPNFKAFHSMLKKFIKEAMIDGWIYVKQGDGRYYPELIMYIGEESRSYRHSEGDPKIIIKTCYYGFDGSRNERMGLVKASHEFTPGDVAKKTVANALAAKGILKESAELKAEYLRTIDRHHKVTANGFAKQYRFTGTVLRTSERYGKDVEAQNRKVIHDIAPSEYGSLPTSNESELFDNDKPEGGTGPVPFHPIVKVYDLKEDEFYWVHGDTLVPHVYDKSLRHKLVLPESQRDMLDVLTNDTDVFTADIIEGKAAGNIIIGVGIPGLGKTLTAEVYAELKEKPLYSVHVGTLGTSPDSVENGLKTVFARAKRWGCVLLLDEADVFVKTRGDDLEQNAIVAEFLRVLEYYDGLLFMTTNRPGDIDEAIISRAAAIIRYDPPTSAHAATIWRVMADNFGEKISDELVDQLVELFPEIAPRDIKMLFRLALRVAKSHKTELTLDVFRRCAMFRAIKMSETIKKK